MKKHKKTKKSPELKTVLHSRKTVDTAEIPTPLVAVIVLLLAKFVTGVLSQIILRKYAKAKEYAQQLMTLKV